MNKDLFDLLSQEGPEVVSVQLLTGAIPIEMFILQAQWTLPLATDDVHSSFALLLEYAFDAVDILLDDLLAQQRYSDALTLVSNLEQLASAIRENVARQNAQLVGGIWNRIAVHYQNIAEANQILEAFAKAVSSVEAAFALAPDEPHVRNNMVVIYGTFGQNLAMHQEFDQAMPYFARALQVDPQSDESWRLLGLCFIAKSDVANGINCLKQAARLGNTLAADALRQRFPWETW